MWLTLFADDPARPNLRLYWGNNKTSLVSGCPHKLKIRISWRVKNKTALNTNETRQQCLGSSTRDADLMGPEHQCFLKLPGWLWRAAERHCSVWERGVLPLSLGEKKAAFTFLYSPRGGEAQRTKDYSGIIPLVMWRRHSHYEPGQMTHHVNPLVGVLISWLEV